jgi:maleylpyruvate isomerase
VTPDLAAVAAAEVRLDVTVSAMTDEELAEASRLPGWTRAMLVTHLALNATSNAAMVAAALRGEQRPQYPGGPAQRAAEIEAGRGRSAAEVLAALRAAAVEWAFVMASVHDWSIVVPAGVGPRPIGQRVASRLFEVEVHHADLGLGYGFRDWPPAWVEERLAWAVAGLPGRAAPGAAPGRWRVGPHEVVTAGDATDVAGAVNGEPAALLAWLLGRETVASAGLTVSGDARVARLPAEHPFP